MGDDRKPRPVRNEFRLAHAIRDLPVEVVVRDEQKRFLPAVRISDVKPGVFSPQMHVRRETGHVHVLLERVALGDFNIGIAGRDQKEKVRQIHALGDLLGWLRGKNNPYAGDVDFRLLGSFRVMDLKAEIRSGWNFARRALGENIRFPARKVRAEHAPISKFRIPGLLTRPV